MASILNPKRVCDTALRALFWVWFYCMLFFAASACMELILMLPELI